MPGESYFMAFAALGVSLAGFAGLITALRRSTAVDAVFAYRIRNIVALGFGLTFVGFGTIAAYAATANLSFAARVGSLFLSLQFFRGLVFETRPGNPAWATDGSRRFAIAVLIAMLALTLLNVVVVGEIRYLQILMLLGLLGPVTIFYATIQDATRVQAGASSSDPSEG